MCLKVDKNNKLSVFAMDNNAPNIDLFDLAQALFNFYSIFFRWKIM